LSAQSQEQKYSSFVYEDYFQSLTAMGKT